MWAVATPGSQVGEFDVSDEPGWIDGDGMGGMSGIVWVRGKIAETYPRKLYANVEEWVVDVAAEYPDAEIVRADSEPQNWL
jgi:hypothetical protein